MSQLRKAAYAFFGVVDFFGAAFLAGAFLLAAEAFFSGCGAWVLTTRPDLVLPRVSDFFSSTAGAYSDVSIVAIRRWPEVDSRRPKFCVPLWCLPCSW